MHTQLRFRNIYSETYKQRFEGVQPSNTLGESNMVKGNNKYIAFPWQTAGGGSLAVLEADKPQQLPSIFPKITGHQGKILDLEFYPFLDNLIATSSEDTTIKIWQIPEEFNEDIVEPMLSLNAHDKKVTLISFNPTSQSILASGSTDNSIKIWNVENPQQELESIQGPDNCQGASSLEWNYNGSLLGTIWKDRNMRIIDPRSQENQFVVSCVECFEGLKSQKFQWVGDEDKCITTGFSKKFERQIKLWDLKNIGTPLQTITLDSAAGLIFPFYDEDTQVLYIACKGEGSIKKFEYSQGQLFNVGAHTSTDSGTFYGFFPKRCVNVTIHELMKGIKVTDKYIEFISFRAPRKSTNYQTDLYPDCYAGVASQTAQDYINRQNSKPIKEPVLKYQKQQVNLPKQLSNAAQQIKSISEDLLNTKQKTEQPFFLMSQELDFGQINHINAMELETLKQGKKEFQTEIERLMSENSLLKEQNLEIQENMKMLQEKQEQVINQSQQQDQQQQNSDYSFILKSQQQEEHLSSLKEELQSLKDKIKSQENDCQNHNERIAQLTNQNQQLTVELENSRKQIKNLNFEKEKLVNQLQQQQQQAKQTSQTVANKNFTQNQGGNEKLEDEIKQLKIMNDQQQVEIAELKITKVMENDESSQVEKIITQNKTIQDLNQKLKELEDQNLNLKQDLLLYQAKEMTEDEALIYQTKIELIEDKLKQRKNALTQAADSIKILKKRNQELEQLIQEKDKQNLQNYQ